MVGVDPALLVQQTCQAVAQERLYRCLVCEAVIEWTFDLSSLSPGGALYELAVKIHGPLNPHKKYSFPTHGEAFNLIGILLLSKFCLKP